MSHRSCVVLLTVAALTSVGCNNSPKPVTPSTGSAKPVVGAPPKVDSKAEFQVTTNNNITRVNSLVHKSDTQTNATTMEWNGGEQFSVAFELIRKPCSETPTGPGNTYLATGDSISGFKVKCTIHGNVDNKTYYYQVQPENPLVPISPASSTNHCEGCFILAH
jgi:hypothetical protein